jgi:phosphohistidine swiveling domain-containing protein
LRGRSPAGRIKIRGIAHTACFDAPEAGAPGAEDELRGIGCSPGRVRGRAKVVMDAEGDVRIDGDILVAPMTDPGWVFLMVAASGLVSERGSPLSHTAIIGRELGVPTIVGVPGATQRIADGCQLEIDGDRGTIRIAGSEQRA